MVQVVKLLLLYLCCFLLCRALGFNEPWWVWTVPLWGVPVGYVMRAAYILMYKLFN